MPTARVRRFLASEFHGHHFPYPQMKQVRTRMMHRLYAVLRERGDNFYHWMTSMYDVGEVRHDPTLSGLDEATYRQPGT